MVFGLDEEFVADSEDHEAALKFDLADDFGALEEFVTKHIETENSGAIFKRHQVELVAFLPYFVVVELVEGHVHGV